MMCLPPLSVKRRCVICVNSHHLEHRWTNKRSNCLVIWQKERNNQCKYFTASREQYSDAPESSGSSGRILIAPFGISFFVLAAYLEGRPDGCRKVLCCQN